MTHRRFGSNSFTYSGNKTGHLCKPAYVNEYSSVDEMIVGGYSLHLDAQDAQACESGEPARKVFVSRKTLEKLSKQPGKRVFVASRNIKPVMSNRD